MCSIELSEVVNNVYPEEVPGSKSPLAIEDGIHDEDKSDCAEWNGNKFKNLQQAFVLEDGKKVKYHKCKPSYSNGWTDHPSKSNKTKIDRPRIDRESQAEQGGLNSVDYGPTARV